MLKFYPDSSGGKGGTAWIDLHDPTPDERRQAAEVSKVEIPARSALEEIESSSRLRVEHDTLYLSMTVSAHSDQNESAPTPVGFVLNERVLVTVRYTELKGFESAKEQLARGSCRATPVGIFTALLEGMVDFGADVLQQIAADLNGISRRVFQARAFSSTRKVAVQTRGLRNTMIEVGQRGEKLSQIRESLLGLQLITSFVAEKGQGRDWIDNDIQARLKTATADVASLTDFEVHLTDKVQFLLDAVLGFINTEQNDIFKVLTIVSVVGVPPTLIAGIYGMNFQGMPEYHWSHGYAWGLSLIFLSTILPVVWFKWRGWW
jgi:magnesium transporter